MKNEAALDGAHLHGMTAVFASVAGLVLVGGALAQAPAPEPPPSSELLRNAEGGNEPFAAVGQFKGSLSCTGTLIDPSGTGSAAAKAWFLTAGHCVSLEPYGVIRNQPLAVRVQFRFFVDTPTDRRVTVATRTVGWSTMKGTDLALVELDATLGDLGARGIRPLRLASSTPDAGRAVFWTGISGAPIPPEMQFVRMGRCTEGRRVQLLERFWIWTDDVSNDCPDLYAGASGSPLFDAATSEIIGVISTTTLLNSDQGPDFDCQLNRPCVMGAAGPAMEKDTSYAAQVRGIAQCFDAANGLDLERPGCPLDPGFQLNVQSGDTEVRPALGGNAATWGAALSGKHPYYAYKRYRAGEDECASLAGYGPAIALSGASLISDPIGLEDGYYFLCVIAGDTPSFDASWQQPSHASIRFKRIDSQPPQVTVDYELEPLQNGYRLVFLTGGEDPNGLGLALTKGGPLGAVDCSDPRGYRVQISIPDVVRDSEQPARICSWFSDKAGNFGDPAVFDFGPPAMLPNAVRNSASARRGTAAPASMFRVDTFNLTGISEYNQSPTALLAGVRLSVRDAAGRSLPVPMTTAGPLFLEAVMPDTVTAGPATVIVQPPEGAPLAQPLTIRTTAPGLFPEIGGAAPRGFAWDGAGHYVALVNCVEPTRCFVAPVKLSSAEGGLDFVLYGTGLRAGRGVARLLIGTHTVDAVEIRPHAEIPGVDEVRFHLPRDFPLRLYQAIAVDTPDGVSNYLWIYLE